MRYAPCSMCRFLLAKASQRTDLRNKLNQQIAEMNTLRSLPLNIPGPHVKSSGKGGNEVGLFSPLNGLSKTAF